MLWKILVLKNIRDDYKEDNSDNSLKGDLNGHPNSKGATLSQADHVTFLQIEMTMQSQIFGP